MGLQTRLVGAAAALVLVCGGFLAYRAVAAIDGAYRWNGEAEAAALAQAFVRSLSPRDVTAPDRIRARLQRLAGVHPDLTGVAVSPAPPGTARRAAYAQTADVARLTYPILDDGGRPVALLELRFALDERNEAAAAGRREVVLAGAGAALLLLIGVGALSRLLLVRPLERLARSARGLAAGEPAGALHWRRRDAIGALAGSIDVLAVNMRSLKARIDGLVLKDPLTGVLNHRGLHDALHEALESAGTRREKVALVVLDIDHFDRLNDSAGHATGDDALRMATRVIEGELRPGDACGRIGGDEFLIALPDSDAWGAERVVERLRSAIAAMPVGSRRRRRPSARARPASPTPSTRWRARSTSRTAPRPSTRPAPPSTRPCWRASSACPRRRSRDPDGRDPARRRQGRRRRRRAAQAGAADR